MILIGMVSAAVASVRGRDRDHELVADGQVDVEP